jgi:PAS domain S-box-containing protein
MSIYSNITDSGSGRNSDRYRAFFDSVPEPVFFMSPEGEILDANPACKALFTQYHQACIGSNVYAMMDSDSKRQKLEPRLRAMVQEVVRTGQGLCFEKVQNEKILMHSIWPLFSPEGEVVELCVRDMDVTQQTFAERRSCDIQTQFEFILEKCHLGLWTVDVRDGSVYHTLEHDRIFGYDSLLQEWNHEIFLDHVVPEDRLMVAEEFRKIIDQQATWTTEYRIRRADGELRWLLDIGGCERDEHGTVIRMAGVSKDITDLKQVALEQQLLQSQWDFVLHKKKIGLWKMDLDTLTVHRISKNTDILGYGINHELWSLQTFFDCIVPDERAEVERVIRASLDRREDLGVECRIRRIDGDIRWVNIAGIFQDDQSRGTTHLLGIIQDITERKEREAEHGRLEAELQQSHKMDLLGQLAGGIAHDFNNILSAILGNTEAALLQIDESHPCFENLDSIRHSVNRSAEMVKQLLAFARKQPWNPVTVDVDVEMGRIRQMLTKLIRENIDLRWNLHASQAMVNIDPSNLVQIITNLCINSRDAIAEEGAITIETDVVRAADCDGFEGSPGDVAGEFVSISVSDTGCGIDQQTLPHVFEPFFTTKKIGKGTGLGLSMVYGLVRQNGGSITCQSDVSAGTTFRILLPVSKATEVHQEKSADDPIEMNHTDEILLIEDEPSILKIIKSALERKGFQVTTATNAKEGIEVCEQREGGISLVISDVIMPGMNGIEMSHEVLKKHPKTKFIFMSGYSAESFDQDYLINNKMNFISKPFKIIDFITLVESVLTR